MVKKNSDIAFIQRVQKLVDENGSQAKLAKKAGMSQQDIAKYLAGSEPTRPKLIDLARAAKCSLSWLATGEEEGANGKVVATIEPGSKEKKARLREASTRITETDNSLRVLVEWMDSYFGSDPDQVLPFVFDLARQYPSFTEYLEKKQDGHHHMDTQAPPLSANDNG